MSQSTQSKLYFAAAALILIAGAIGLAARGVEFRFLAWLALAGIMVALGLKAR